MQSPVVLRRFREEDVEEISRLEAQCIPDAWSVGLFRDFLKDQNSIGLLAGLGDKIVGFCSVTNISGEGEVNNVAVLPSFRGRGIASALMEELLRQGETMGITDFTLEVRVGNSPAVHLYEKLGFVSEGIRPGFYRNPTEDAMIMWRRGPRGQ